MEVGAARWRVGKQGKAARCVSGSTGVISGAGQDRAPGCLAPQQVVDWVNADTAPWPCTCLATRRNIQGRHGRAGQQECRMAVGRAGQQAARGCMLCSVLESGTKVCLQSSLTVGWIKA